MMDKNIQLGRPEKLQWRWVVANTNANLDLRFVDAAQMLRFTDLLRAFLQEEKAEGAERTL